MTNTGEDLWSWNDDQKQDFLLVYHSFGGPGGDIRINSLRGGSEMKNLSVALVVFFVLLGALAYADEVGVMYDCAFPVTVTLDGDFGDWPGIPWHAVTHDMGWDNPDNDADGSLEFACVADNEFLYVAVKIKDDAKVVDENTGGDVWQDDSVELYVDGGNEKAGSYDANDAQITIGRDNVGGDVDNPMMGGSGPRDNTKAAVVETGDGWALEAAVFLADFGVVPSEGVVIGYNIQLNDDDDRNGRDHKLAWSSVELASGEGSWNNPQMFAELQFVADSAAVSAEGKLTTTWGSIKH